MNIKQQEDLSILMSYILRHNPYEFGLVLDRDGACEIEDLLMAIQQRKKWISVIKSDIENVVTQCAKQRFEIKENRIRARYGHSKVKVDYEEKTPPPILYHGTYKGALEKIKEEGIKEMQRPVHLSETTHFASLAGKRRGELVLLKIDTKKASELGTKFYYAGGEVWISTNISPLSFTVLEEM